MDSRLLPYLAAAGWALLTLGIAGAVGLSRWWVWPISAGVALLAVAGAYWWALVVEVRAEKKAAKPVTGEVRT